MKKIITILGMQCNHCKMSVEEALSQLEGVTKVEVDLDKKIATIEINQEVDNNKIIEAIEDIGFEVANIEE
ncbi:MAG: heavy-metal-associated domain-containing protein [Clostridia bacterium]